MNGKTKCIGCVSFCVEDNKIWCIDSTKNIFVELDRECESVQVLSFLEEDEYPVQGFRGKVFKKDEGIIFAPSKADNIAIYNLVTREFRLFPLKSNLYDKRLLYDKQSKLDQIFVFDEYVIMPGNNYPAIVRVNTDTNSIDYFDSFSDEIEKRVINGKNYAVFGKGGFIIEDSLYLPVACSPSVLRFDISSGNSEIITVDCPFDGIYTMNRFEDNIYITGIGVSSGKVGYVDCKFSSYQEIDLPDRGFKEYTTAFFEPIIMNNKMYIFPISEKHAYEVDLSSNEIRICDEIERMIDIRENRNISYRINAIGYVLDTLIFLCDDYRWFELNVNSGIITEKKYEIGDEKMLVSIYKSNMKKVDMFTEGEISLDVFLMGISSVS